MSEEAIARIEEDVKIIKTAIVGDIETGEIGFMGKLALVKQSLGKAWWFIMGITMTIIGSAFWIIKSGL